MANPHSTSPVVIILRPVEIKLADSPGVDAFGRLRVSSPEDLFNASFQYDLNPLLFLQTTATGGTITHLPNESSAELAVTGSVGSLARLQARFYSRYLPLRSQLIAMTQVPGAADAGCTRRFGYQDSQDGILLEQNGTVDLALVRRTFTSGAAVDNRVTKANWNLDKLDGTGDSGITLDLSKGQIFVVDFQWLGHGRVRVGFAFNGRIVYAHEFLSSNTLSVPYMRTGCLPVTWEIERTIAGGAATMKVTCCDVMSEGGFHYDRGIPFSRSNGSTLVTATTAETLVLALRMDPNCPAGTAILNESLAFLVDAALYANTADAYYWRVVYGGTLTDVGFADHDGTHSAMQFSTTCTYTAATGIQILDGYVAGNISRVPSVKPISTKLPLARNGFGTVGATTPVGNVAILATHLGAGSGAVGGTFSWNELR